MRGPLTLDRIKLLGPIAALVVGLVAPSVAKADTPAIQQLMENARYWQKRGRSDRAVEAWNKVLRASPRHPGALSALGNYYARKGNKRAALKMLKRLRGVQPNSAKVAKLERAITVGNTYEKLLGEARALVKERKFDAAVAKYKEAFGGTPPRAMALEFYQTLGGSQNGWEPAEQGLRKLHEASPRKTRYRLALAKHLSYREHTRREGIRMLAEMAQHSKARKQARHSWRQSLIWLHIGPNDIARLEQYLSVVGEDKEIRRRMTDWSKTVTVRQAVASNSKSHIDYKGRQHTEVFELINADKVDEADAKLGALEKRHSHDAICLLARGIIQMRRQQFTDATKTLEAAKAKAPGKKELWEKPLAESKFWSVVKQAEKLRLSGEFDKSEAMLNEALKMTIQKPEFAQLQLAHLHAAKQEFTRAEEMYRAVLKDSPKNTDAIRGLVMVFVGTQQVEEALALNKQLIRMDKSKAFPEKQLEAEALRARARVARDTRKLNEARELLERAVSLDPTNKWAALDLAYTLNDLGLREKARAQVDRLLSMDSKLVPAKLLKAQLLADSGQFRRAMEYLGQVGDGSLNKDALKLKNSLQIRLLAKKAVSDAMMGKMMNAERSLHELTVQIRGNSDLVGHVALAWADIGNYERAIRVLRDALAQEPKNMVDMQLQLAAILLRGNLDREFATIVNELIQGERSLSARQMTDLAQLRVAHAVRTADRLREAGEYKRAFQYLRPLLQEHRSDANLYSALGRLFLSSGEPMEARTVFLRVLKHNPKNLDARDGAVAASITLHKRDDARHLVLQGLAQSKRSPRMHLIAGRYYATVGEDDSAMEVLEQGLMLADGSADGRLKGRSMVKRHRAPRISQGASTDQIVALAQANFVGDSRSDSDDMQMATGIEGELRTAIDSISKRYNTEVGSDLSFRHRFGEVGLSQLSEFSLPVWASVPLGYRGRVIFSAMPIFLSAGEAAMTEDGAWTRLGTGALQAGAAPGDSVPQSAAGAALGIAYSYKGFSAGVGSTPLGFPLSTVTAGVTYKQQFGSFGLSISGDRKPLTDSLLSYAGQTDPVTGEVWGGVMHNKGRIDLAYISQDMTMYIFGGASYIQGTFTPDNIYAVGGLGAIWSVAKWDGNELLAGINASVLSYKDNLRYFSLGHAGYFSPQLFAHAGVPFRWASNSGKFSWAIKGEPGLNYFEEDAPAYFPQDAARQSALSFITDEEGEAQPGTYPERDSSFGFALDATAQISYQLMPNLVLGLTAEYHTAEDYQEFAGMGNIRFQFTKRKASPGISPEMGEYNFK
ncbi:MAG: tetratricopeptide (TPR) repeat protein [Myxococcota bacterium]|jgi:tetratricopeptide (TPR) repeat protein